MHWCTYNFCCSSDWSCSCWASDRRSSRGHIFKSIFKEFWKTLIKHRPKESWCWVCVLLSGNSFSASCMDLWLCLNIQIIFKVFVCHPHFPMWPGPCEIPIFSKPSAEGEHFLGSKPLVITGRKLNKQRRHQHLLLPPQFPGRSRYSWFSPSLSRIPTLLSFFSTSFLLLPHTSVANRQNYKADFSFLSQTPVVCFFFLFLMTFPLAQSLCSHPPLSVPISALGQLNTFCLQKQHWFFQEQLSKLTHFTKLT